MSSDDSNSNPFGESPANGTPDPKNPFQFASGGAKTETPPSPFEISASNPFAPKETKEEPPKEGFDMKGFSGEPKPMNQLEAAPVDKKPETTVPSVPKLTPTADSKPAVPAPPATPPPVAPATPAPPAASAAPAPATTPAPAAPAAAAVGLPDEGTKQLVLRAIFGVDHELTHQQIIQRARTLPGVKNISTVNAEAANALSTVRELVGSLGFGSASDIVLSSPEGAFDFISAGGTTLAILREGEYAPGVRETLILIAQEIDKL